MPERLDRVEVGTARKTVVLTWSSRQELLERMRKRYGLHMVVVEFENAGTSRPVKFSQHTREVLEVLVDWLGDVGRDEIPPDVLELHDALYDDFFGTDQT